MEVGIKPELAVLKLIWALRYEAPKARLSGKRFYFPKNSWSVKAAEKLFASLGHPLGQKNELSLMVKHDYVTLLHLSGERPLFAVIVPEGGDRLVLWTRSAKIVAPYDHAYFELYALLWKRMRQHRKKSKIARFNDGAYKAVYYYWKSWRSLDSGRPFDPPPDGGWPHVPPFF